MSDPEDKKPIVPPPARSRVRKPTPVPGKSGVKPLTAVFEVAGTKWEPKDADGGEGEPIGYALALELHEE